MNNRQIKLFIHEDGQLRSFRFISCEMKDEIVKNLYKEGFLVYQKNDTINAYKNVEKQNRLENGIEIQSANTLNYPNLKYPGLHCSIFNKFDETIPFGEVMGVGHILDYYSIFNENNIYEGRSKVGEGIYKIKYCGISEAEREDLIADFAVDFIEILKFKLSNSVPSNTKLMQTISNLALDNLIITYIPSSKQIPEILSEIIAKKCGLKRVPLIIKKSGFKDSKGITSFEESVENAFEKYDIDENYLIDGARYLIIDDVFGYGGSMIAVLSKLYKKDAPNLFFCVAKDTKR